MKLLYITPTGMIGGAEMVLLDLLDTLRAARPDWSIKVLLGDDGPLAGALETRGIDREVVPLPQGIGSLGDAGLSGRSRLAGTAGLLVRGGMAGFAIASYVTALRGLIRQFDPDCVHTNGMKAHVLGTWATPRAIPMVWHLHDFLGSRAVMGRLLTRVVRRGVNGVAVSTAVETDAREALRGRIPIQTIENAVDVDHFAPPATNGTELDRAAGLKPASPGTVRVGLVATFAMWKGHELFLEAAAKVTHRTPARFYIVGGPIYRSAGSQVDLDDLRTRVAELGLAGQVAFTGHVTDPASALRALDVIVHASTRPEPFGRVIVEGMACGKAVIAMEEGGAAALIRDGVDALACPPRNATALAERIGRLICDPDLRTRLGAEARQTALGRFDRRALAGTWTQLYQSLVLPGRVANLPDAPSATTAPDARPA